MLFIPLTAIINQPPLPVVSTTIDFMLEKEVQNSDINTYYVQYIGTTATTGKENTQPMYWDIFNEDNLDLVIKTLPKTSMTKKVRIVSITKFQPKVFL